MTEQVLKMLGTLFNQKAYTGFTTGGKRCERMIQELHQKFR